MNASGERTIEEGRQTLSHCLQSPIFSGDDRQTQLGKMIITVINTLQRRYDQFASESIHGWFYGGAGIGPTPPSGTLALCCLPHKVPVSVHYITQLRLCEHWQYDFM